jgi:hypothetical protein
MRKWESIKDGGKEGEREKGRKGERERGSKKQGVGSRE